MKCIGHGGASDLAPANTLRSFELAAQLGADVIEFDVRLARGRLLLAHSQLQARRRCLDLEEGLRLLAEPRFEHLELVADLKTPGTEAPVVDGLRRHGLLDRALITSQCPPILRRVHEHDPAARTGISVAGWGSRRLQRWRQWREEVVAAIRGGQYTALMAYHRLIDDELVERVSGAGGELYAWTVRGHGDARALATLGVDGVVVADPRVMHRAFA